MLKKVLALSLVAAMTLTIVTGCKKETTNVTNKPSTQVSETLPPGVEYKSNIGESFDYTNGLNVTLKEVVETKDQNTSTESSYMACFVEAKNNGNEDVRIYVLDDFKVFVDGVKLDENSYTTTLSNVYAKNVYSEFGFFDGTIKKGESLSGYVSFETPKSWDTLEVIFFPNALKSNDTIKYTITPSDIKPKY